MAQQLRAMIALPEDQGSFPSTSQLSVIPFLGDSIPLYRHICRQKKTNAHEKNHLKKQTMYTYILKNIYTHIHIY